MQAELPPQHEMAVEHEQALGFGAYKGPATAKTAASIEFFHFPIIDLDIPRPEVLEAALKELECLLEAGRTIYLHCWGGRGRAGTVACTLLMRAYKLSSEEAMERVQRAFATRNDTVPLSPETEEQRAFVKAFT